MLFVNLDIPSATITAAYVQVVQPPKPRAIFRDVLQAATPDTLASIIKIPVDAGKNPPGEIPYDQLVCTDTDKQKIGKIISTMAENGKLSLLFKSNELKQLGAEVNHVHPLKFLSSIFGNPHLKTCMKDVYSDYFKWSGFMDGLSPGMTSQAERGKIDLYLPEFAKEVGVSPDALRGYVKSRDWENLVRYLIDN